MTYKEALEIIQQYHSGNAIDSSKYMSAMDLVELALEKQRSQKPIIDKNWCFSLLCPNCRTKLADTEHCWDKQKEMIISHYVYCSECGQMLDWSDLE